MKKLMFFAYAGAIALLGAGLSSCSSSDDAVEPNPNFNAETNEVYAQFVFNVSTGNTPNMRMTSAATQATNTESFRGIDNAVLLSAKQTTDGKHIPVSAVMDKRYDLSRVLTANAINKEKTTRVIETSLPINTNTLLFYGRAIQGTLSSSEEAQGLTAYDQFGHLETYSVAGGDEGLSLANTTFELSSRINGNVDQFKQIENLLAGLLTVIMNSNLAGSNHVALSASKYTFDVTTDEYPELTWADYVREDGMSPVETSHVIWALEKKLADAYREMTTIKQSEGELRAGYGEAILNTIQDLWSVVNEVRCATPFSKGEAVAKYFAERIHERIKQYFNGTVPNDGKSVTDVDFESLSNVITHFAADTAWPTTADTRPTDFSLISDDIDLADFPQKLYHVTAGSAHYQFDTTKHQFVYVQDYNTSAVGGGGGFTIESYYYPAELLYFGNSPIRVSNNANKTDNYPQTVANWQKDSEWTSDWVKSSHVTSSTQSVAMQNDINYGTSLLKTTISYGATTLKDNNHAIQVDIDPDLGDNDEPDQSITVDGSTFQLKGVIIGGQWKKVGWDYLPQTTGNKQGYVFDCAITDAAAAIPATGSSQPNYTLLFDNYNAATPDKQDKVYVALELMNNSGKDFFGEHNVIRKGAIFYLIGELDITGKAAPTWPVSHPLPPYNTDGTSIETPRVFMQDYMTSANFVIGEHSLKHALLTVPDLRYSALTLGMTVNIEWSTGIDFGNVILGGEE
ncbi:MAG: hypothetical protein IJV44_05640 [Prevotella sp.]|nr:hypothetical protein [Prevotella sp.]